jgi:hypothetical protein
LVEATKNWGTCEKKKKKRGTDRWSNRHSGSASEKHSAGAGEKRLPDLERRQEAV